MKIAIYGIITIVLFVVVSYICSFRFFNKKTDISRKKLFLRIFLIIISPILLYVFITCILMLIRCNDFVGYYVASDTIYYDGDYYKEVTDEAKKEEIFAYGDGYWTYTETFISSDKIKFPFFEYWIPDLFFGHVVVPGEQDDIYIIVRPMEEQLYFERQ